MDHSIERDKLVGNIRENILGLRPSATLAVNERSAALAATGRKIYRLGFGQSPFPVPDLVVDALRSHANQKDYLPVAGLYELRQAIANWHNQRHEAGYRTQDVIVGPGSKELLFLLQMTLEGTLLLPNPSWVSYEPQSRLSTKPIKWIETYEENNWLLQPGDLESACLNAPNRPLLLLLNYPNNPTGASYSSDDLYQLAEIARKHHVIVLSDEIYGELQFNGEHISIASYYPQGTIVSTGLSKWCGAGGWRLGAILIPGALNNLQHAVATAASETYTAASTPIQYAAAVAFNPHPVLESYVKNSRLILKMVSQYVHRSLSDMHVNSHPAVGSFYLFPNFEFYRSGLANAKVRNSFEFCELLLEDTGIALLPGSDFGRPESELTARLSFVDFNGQKALELFEKEKKPDVSIVAPDIVEAMGVLRNWLDKYQ